MPTSIEQMCRTCMLNETKRHNAENKTKVKMKEKQMVSIFDVQEEAKEKLNLVELIKAAVPQLKIEQNDQLPKHVCMECSEKIKEIYNFQQNCIDIEMKFYKMLEKEHTINPFNETVDQDDETFKTEFNESFIDEDSLNSEEETIMEKEINEAAMAKEEFIQSCSDWSIDLVWDEKSNAEWEPKKVQSKTIKRNHSNPASNAKNGEVELDDKRNQLKKNRRERAAEYTIKKTKKLCESLQQCFPCDICKIKLKSEFSLKKHQETHNRKKDQSYKCNICKEAFTDKATLKEHMRSHVGEQVFLCSQCGKSYKTAGGLKEHSYRHLNEKNFQCPDCPRSFITKKELVAHHIIHKAKPKTHICDICGRGFHKPFLLKKHKMYHNNDRPFACEFCEKRFVTNEKLKRHIRIHTGEKPYKCNYCKNTYCQSSELIKHLQSHLGDNVYQCEMCPLRFKTVKILRLHFSTHKNDDEQTKTRNLNELNALEMKGVFFNNNNKTIL